MRVIILSATLTFFLIFITLTIDYNSYQCRLWNSIFYVQDCDFKMPQNYFLGKLNNRYVIGYRDYGNHYLTGYEMAGISCIYPDIRKPSTFSDSCAAKGYLEAYLAQERENNVEINIVEVNSNK